jgi:hypothetical protein
MHLNIGIVDKDTTMQPVTRRGIHEASPVVHLANAPLPQNTKRQEGFEGIFAAKYTALFGGESTRFKWTSGGWKLECMKNCLSYVPLHEGETKAREEDKMLIEYAPGKTGGAAGLFLGGAASGLPCLQGTAMLAWQSEPRRASLAACIAHQLGPSSQRGRSSSAAMQR